MQLVLCIKCKVLFVEEGMVELYGKLLAWFRVEELSVVIAATLMLYLVPQIFAHIHVHIICYIHLICRSGSSVSIH